MEEQPIEETVPAQVEETANPEVTMKQEMKQLLNEEQPTELSDKLKNRNEIISEIQKLCDKLGKPYPVKLKRKRKTELSEILAGLINQGINASYTAGQEKVKNDVEFKKECEKEQVITSSAVSALMNIQFLTYTAVERLSYSNKHRLGDHYLKDVVKSIQENEKKKEELRILLKNVYLLYREDLEEWMHPLTLLALFNVQHCASCITREGKEKNELDIVPAKDEKFEQPPKPTVIVKPKIAPKPQLRLSPVQERIKQLRAEKEK